MSHGIVHPLWRAHALQPHRVDVQVHHRPAAEAKIYDVARLYLNLPRNAFMLSLDKKREIQALRHGLPARQTHDYRRNGLTSLFAALEIRVRGGRVRAAAHRHRLLALHQARRAPLSLA